MTLEKHAMREFKAAGWVDENGKWTDDMQQCICKNVLAMLKAFSEGNHSGSTALYALELFRELASFEPVSPLSGDDSEWNKVDDGMWQNNRCSHVFKGADGQAYDIKGKIFKDCNGSCHVNTESSVYITFPYMPKSEYVEICVGARGVAIEDRSGNNNHATIKESKI